MMSRLLPYLQLCRLPTVFTAMADIFLGYLLVHEGMRAGEGRVGEFLLLLTASACLYLSGMVWNDVADRGKDAVERPSRPLPSDRVSFRGAIWFGGVLMIVGVVCAAVAGGASLWVSLALAASILAYDFGLKRTPLGPIAMGLCRFFNVLLGASSAAESFDQVLQRPQLWVAAGLGVYIVGVTWFARTEAMISRRGQLAGAMLVVNTGLATLMGWIVSSPGDNSTTVLLAMAVITLTINRRLAAALFEPVPANVQRSIRTMLLSIIVLDATLIAHRLGADGVSYAVATVCLLIPAMFLGRWIRMT